MSWPACSTRENKIGAALTVVPMKNWSRDQWFDATGMEWVNPSPNMRNLNEATLYPGIGAIEYANLSVGRGTDTPFEQVGAPWIDGPRLAEALNARRLPGVRVYPTTFTPSSSKYAGELCRGVFLIVTDRDAHPAGARRAGADCRDRAPARIEAGHRRRRGVCTGRASSSRR